MPTVTRENIGVLNDKIIVRVAKEDYLPGFEKALKTYSKQANIPGFRKGMVPTGMIKKMHGSSVFADEVIRAAEKSLSDYMSHEQLDIFGQPLPLADTQAPAFDMSNPAEYAFEFEVGLKPAFTLPDFTTLKLARYQITVTEEMVNDEITRLQTRLGTMTEPDTITHDENILNLHFAACDAEGNELEGGIKKDNSLLVKYFAENFRNQWMGKKKDDTLVLQLSTAFEDKEREFILKDLELTDNNANSYFKATLTKLGWVEKAALDEAFFKKAFPNNTDMATEADFRSAIEADIQKQFDRHASANLQDQIYHSLLEHTTIEFPAAFLKRWIQTSSEKPKTPEQVDAEFPAFTNSLKWSLVIARLVQQSKIEVLPDDLRAFAKHQLISYMGGQIMDTEQPWMNDYVERMMKDKKFVEDSFHRIETEKIFAWAETQVTPTDTPISLEDFNKLQEGHKH